jgi:hypothetical protein
MSGRSGIYLADQKEIEMTIVILFITLLFAAISITPLFIGSSDTHEIILINE